MARTRGEFVAALRSPEPILRPDSEEWAGMIERIDRTGSVQEVEEGDLRLVPRMPPSEIHEPRSLRIWGGSRAAQALLATSQVITPVPIALCVDAEQLVPVCLGIHAVLLREVGLPRKRDTVERAEFLRLVPREGRPEELKAEDASWTKAGARNRPSSPPIVFCGVNPAISVSLATPDSAFKAWRATRHAGADAPRFFPYRYVKKSIFPGQGLDEFRRKLKIRNTPVSVALSPIAIRLLRIVALPTPVQV